MSNITLQEGVVIPTGKIVEQNDHDPNPQIPGQKTVLQHNEFIVYNVD